MARRSRSRGAGKSKGKSRNPAPLSPVAMELEAALDDIADAIEAQDVTRIWPATTTAIALIAEEPQAFVNRLVSGRERLPGVAMPMLFDATGEAAPVYLRRIIKARYAADHVRFEAQRLLGFEPKREQPHRIGFLSSLRDPEGTLANICFAVGVTWPSRLFLAEDVLKFIDVMKPDQQVTVLRLIVERCECHAIPTLHATLHLDTEQVALDAIRALTTFRFAGSRGPLERVARLSEHEAVRTAATAALSATDFDRQQIESSDPDTPPFPPQQLTPPDRCVMSAILTSGEQTLSIIRKTGQVDDPIFSGIGFVTDDVNGIADGFTLPTGSLEALDEEIEIVTGAEVPLLDVDSAVIRGAIAMALDTIEHIGLPLAPQFELLEPLIHETYPPAPDEPVTLPILDDTPFADRADLVNQVESLFDSEFFFAWSFDPISVLLIAGDRDLGFPEAWTDEDYTQIIDAMSAPELLAMLRKRLQQQAYLLDLSDESILRDITLAVSASLASATREELINHPFMRQMAVTAGQALAFPLGLGLGDDKVSTPDLLRAMAELEGIDLDELGITDEDLDLDNLDLSDLNLDLDEDDDDTILP